MQQAVAEHTESLKTVTAAVHDSTVKTVQEQMAHLDLQLRGLDDIVVRIKEQNNTHHTAHVASLSNLASNVQTSYTNIGDHFTTSFSRISELDADMSERTVSLQATLPTLSEDGNIRQELSQLRDSVENQALEEYKATGETPQRTTYDCPISLPRTEAHDTFLSRLRNRSASTPSGSPAKQSRSPNKALIFADTSADVTIAGFPVTRPASADAHIAPSLGLRELDVNIVVSSTASQISNAGVDGLGDLRPPLKKQNTTGTESRLPTKKNIRQRMTVTGVSGGNQENSTPPDFSRSIGPGSGRARVLRSNGSS